MQSLLRRGALLALLAAAAPATTLPDRTTRDLLVEAERVCCLSCASIEARRDPRTGIVFTHVRLDLLEDMKGVSPSGTVELRLAGGEAEGVRTVVPGMPTFRLGEEAILLLGPPNALGHPVLLDAGRGVVRLRKEEDGTRILASRVTGVEDLAGKRRVALGEFRTALGEVLRVAAAAREGGK